MPANTSSPAAVRLQVDLLGVDSQELISLFKLAKLGGREGDKVQRAFQNSTAVCFAFDGPRLIGAARALSDREYHATIYDVAVHPDYQRQGIGTRLVNELISMLSAWRVLLVADGDVTEFYRRLGFEPFGNVMGRFDDTRLLE